MFKLLAMAMHFSPYQQGLFDPGIARYLNDEYLNNVKPHNVVDFPSQQESLKKAA